MYSSFDDEKQPLDPEEVRRDGVQILSDTKPDGLLGRIKKRFPDAEGDIVFERGAGMDTFESAYRRIETLRPKIEASIKGSKWFDVQNKTSEVASLYDRLVYNAYIKEKEKPAREQDQSFLKELGKNLSDHYRSQVSAKFVGEEHKFPAHGHSGFIAPPVTRQESKTIAERRALIRSQIPALTYDSHADLIRLLKEYQAMRKDEGTHIFGVSKKGKLDAVENAISSIEKGMPPDPEHLAARKDKLLGEILTKAVEVGLITADYTNKPKAPSR